MDDKEQRLIEDNSEEVIQAPESTDEIIDREIQTQQEATQPKEPKPEKKVEEIPKVNLFMRRRRW